MSFLLSNGTHTHEFFCNRAYMQVISQIHMSELPLKQRRQIAFVSIAGVLPVYSVWSQRYSILCQPPQPESIKMGNIIRISMVDCGNIIARLYLARYVVRK